MHLTLDFARDLHVYHYDRCSVQPRSRVPVCFVLEACVGVNVTLYKHGVLKAVLLFLLQLPSPPYWLLVRSSLVTGKLSIFGAAVSSHQTAHSAQLSGYKGGFTRPGIPKEEEACRLWQLGRTNFGA